MFYDYFELDPEGEYNNEIIESDLSFNGHEEYLRKQPRIRLSGYKKKDSINSISRLLSLMLIDGKKKKTVYVDGENKGKEQCDEHRSRSIDDFFITALYYFKDITLSDVEKLFYVFYLEASDTFWYCPDVNRIVFNVSPYSKLGSYKKIKEFLKENKFKFNK